MSESIKSAAQPLTPLTAAASGPVVLVILDGVGVGPGDAFDAVAQAHTPVLDELSRSGLSRSIAAHGVAVGLPSDADMGNSEVGHNTMGAGRILDQGATRIEKALADGSIWRGTWQQVTAHVLEDDTTLHLIALISDGNVHSHLDHVLALLDRAATERLPRVRVHCLLDGRDVADHSAHEHLARLEQALEEHRAAGHDMRIASGGGRMRITMDRYGADWPMVERGWHAHVLGQAPQHETALQAVAAARAAHPGISDQYLPEFVIAEDGQPVGPVLDGDAVIAVNFRGDRIVEICQAFLAEEFPHFDRIRHPKVLFAGMVLYDGEANMPPLRLVEPEPVFGTVSELLAATGVRQFACSETQKFGHVTYFWNGNRTDPFDPSTETYLELPSDVVPFDTAPQMQSAATADAMCTAIAAGSYQFLRCNFAGGDMVGHTGNLAATVAAMEAIDVAVGQIARAVEQAGGTLVVTADHGNAEDMAQRVGGQVQRDQDGCAVAKTSHSLLPVPLLVREYGTRTLCWDEQPPRPGLSHLAATLCVLLGYQPPASFDPPLITVS